MWAAVLFMCFQNATTCFHLIKKMNIRTCVCGLADRRSSIQSTISNGFIIKLYSYIQRKYYIKKWPGKVTICAVGLVCFFPGKKRRNARFVRLFRIRAHHPHVCVCVLLFIVLIVHAHTLFCFYIIWCKS